MTDFTRRQGLKLGLAALIGAPALLASARTAQAATHQVAIKGFKFSPAALNVAVGDTVVFTNQDGAPHTATALDGSFDTGRLNRGQSGSVTVTTAGEIDYRCNFHATMKGRITAG
ncbi:MAG: cupredoxin family copper-binding protein [Rhodobacter sp.]|nr:cupredoxin family copper-binding protein [Rhodobacter sp.]